MNNITSVNQNCTIKPLELKYPYLKYTMATKIVPFKVCQNLNLNLGKSVLVLELSGQVVKSRWCDTMLIRLQHDTKRPLWNKSPSEYMN